MKLLLFLLAMVSFNFYANGKPPQQKSAPPAALAPLPAPVAWPDGKPYFCILRPEEDFENNEIVRYSLIAVRTDGNSEQPIKQFDKLEDALAQLNANINANTCILPDDPPACQIAETQKQEGTYDIETRPQGFSQNLKWGFKVPLENIQDLLLILQNNKQCNQ